MKPSKNAHANLGADLLEIDFDDLIYYQKPSAKPAARSWDDVPEKIQETFERIGIPEAERAYLAGASAQYESEVVYHNMKEEFQKLGIIFTDTDSALKEYPDLFKQYFAKLVPLTDNKLAALNFVVWSGGTFIYVAKRCQGRYSASNLFPYQWRKYGSVWTLLDYRWWGAASTT